MSAQAPNSRPPTSTVTAIGRIHFEGNIVPLSWFQHLKIAPARPGTQPLPDTVGILILADIVYWYRPEEIRDEATGQIIGWRRKFKADKLQRSYPQWAKLFGFTEKQVMDAIHRLREAGVITTELRTLTVRDRRMNNVLFVEPVPDKVVEMTYRLPSYFKVGGPATLKSGAHYSGVSGCYSEVPTNTETTPEIIGGGDAPAPQIAAAHPLTPAQQAECDHMVAAGHPPAAAFRLVTDIDIFRCWTELTEDQRWAYECLFDVDVAPDVAFKMVQRSVGPGGLTLEEVEYWHEQAKGNGLRPGYMVVKLRDLVHVPPHLLDPWRADREARAQRAKAERAGQSERRTYQEADESLAGVSDNVGDDDTGDPASNAGPASPTAEPGPGGDDSVPRLVDFWAKVAELRQTWQAT